MSIHYAAENDIHNAMSLPSKPAGILLGKTPKESKENLMKWMDKMMKSISRPECLLVDGADIRIEGEYEGLQQGQWGKALQKLQTPAMATWHHEMFQNNMSCGRIMVYLF